MRFIQDISIPEMTFWRAAWGAFDLFLILMVWRHAHWSVALGLTLILVQSTARTWYMLRVLRPPGTKPEILRPDSLPHDRRDD